MHNFTLFFNTFLSNLFVFLVFGVLIVAAVLLGIRLRKSKNKKDDLKEASGNLEEAFVKEQ